MHDEIKVRWSVELDGRHVRGEVRLAQADWDMASPADRWQLARDAVGAAVLLALDVDWNPINAHFDDPNR